MRMLLLPALRLPPPSGELPRQQAPCSHAHHQLWLLRSRLSILFLLRLLLLLLTACLWPVIACKLWWAHQTCYLSCFPPCPPSLALLPVFSRQLRLRSLLPLPLLRCLCHL
jgi:hypothetical protein